MRKRGRPSSASLAVVEAPSPVVRPDAPYDLTDEESAEWWAIVNRLPADWFPRETHGLLAQYCHHAVAAKRVADLIRRAEQGKQLDIDDYDKLLRMQERESRALATLATKMRLSQQSIHDRERKKGKPVSVDSPWS